MVPGKAYGKLTSLEVPLLGVPGITLDTGKNKSNLSQPGRYRKHVLIHHGDNWMAQISYHWHLKTHISPSAMNVAVTYIHHIQHVSIVFNYKYHFQYTWMKSIFQRFPECNISLFIAGDGHSKLSQDLSLSHFAAGLHKGEHIQTPQWWLCVLKIKSQPLG